MPATMTTGNSRPLAACMRHQPDARFLGAFGLVGLRQQRQPVDEPAERRRRRRAIRTRARPRRAPSGSRCGASASSLRSSRRSLQVAGPIEHAVRARSTRSRRQRRRRAPTMRSRNAFERRQRARRQQPPLDGQRRSRAHSDRGDGAGCRPAASSGVSASASPGSTASSASSTRLADAARRHVHHAPEAHVVVRVDEQAQVRERVLDFLALVEPDAADDAVRRRPRASARLQSRATARWCGTARRPSRSGCSRAASRGSPRVMKSASSISSPART